MKTSLVFAIFAATTNGFAPISTTHRATSLFDRVDTSDLIKEALDISKKFGAASPEARLAWEAVEEVDASDNSVATKGSLADECDIYDLSKACEEYADKMAELKSLIRAQTSTAAALKEMVSEVKKVKLTIPEVKPGMPSPQLQVALAEAKKITAEKGIDSPEARVAWETVEEISAADNSVALGAGLTADECLVDAAVEACEALEELNRVMGSNV
ncbi:CP12 domain containing protein [Nitzschia inconspicua]|uniref:CP12 domain containing protein n=1 Tax=Nitzschia inconspicua TaxID=303405 RepID=A0A9K3L2V5_9STRA|nr:CP12 domain containing protein [Nitzschia inconspicua]